ncbi:hypothetical protein BH23CHL2_BH23CHL2_29630 [soil metagenome]
MPRLSHTQEQAYHQIVDVCRRGLPPEELGSEALAAIERAVPADGQRFLSVDPRTLLFDRLLAASDSDHAVRGIYLSSVYLHGGPLGYLDFPELMRQGLSVVAIHDRAETCHMFPRRPLDPIAANAHYKHYHELDSPAGGVLRTCFSVDGYWIAGLDLYRRERRWPFRASDVNFMRLVAPTLGRALRAALALEAACSMRTVTVAPSSAGVLILDAHHRVRYSTPSGEAWSDLLGDAYRSGHGLLPTAVWSALAGLRAPGDATASSSLVSRSPVGPVVVEASPAGEDGSVAIVLRRQHPLGMPEIPFDWPLSPAERSVVELLFQGLDNRRLASRLFVTENTVETHLRHIYEKLDVHSRTELLAHYFKETYGHGLASTGSEGAPS